MKKTNRILLISVSVFVFLIAGGGALYILLGTYRDAPRTHPCGLSLKDQVLDSRKGADMIFQTTIRTSEFLKEKEICAYHVSVDEVPLVNVYKHGISPRSTAEKYSHTENLPKEFTIYDDIHNNALVRGRSAPPPPCEPVGSQKLLFLHDLYIDEFIRTGLLHCSAAAYLRPVTDKPAVLKYIKQLD